MSRPARHYRHYTPEELATIDAMLGHASFEQIGRVVGRDADAIARHLIYARGQSVSAKLAAEGLTPEQLMAELGVSKITTQAWLRRGLLAHAKRVVRKRTITIVSRAAIEAFIVVGGLIDSSARPREPWRTLAEHAAARWAVEYISGPAACDAIGYGAGSLYWLQRRHGFPAPAVPRLSSRPNYYSRAAVRHWLLTHPQFACPRARAALGLPKESEVCPSRGAS